SKLKVKQQPEDSCLKLKHCDCFDRGVRLHDYLIIISNSFNDLLAVLVSTVNQVSWDLSNGSFGADLNLARPHESLHFEQVNNAVEVIFSADWQLHNQWLCAQAVNDGADGVVEVCTHLVHLVNEAD